jgi:hypothetical protein
VHGVIMWDIGNSLAFTLFSMPFMLHTPMNNQEFEALMDKAYGILIPHSTWWHSQTMRNSSILFLVSKGLVNGKHIKPWEKFKKYSSDKRNEDK